MVGSLLMMAVLCVVPMDTASRGHWIGGHWYGHGRSVDGFHMRRAVSTLELWNEAPYYRPTIRKRWSIERWERSGKR